MLYFEPLTCQCVVMFTWNYWVDSSTESI